MKIKNLIILPLIGTFLGGCGYYKSSYHATLLVTSNTETEARIDFGTFDGQYVFNLRRSETEDGRIECDASLKEGTVKVLYYDVFLDVEAELFVIGGGQSIKENYGYVEPDRKYVIIVKSYGEAVDGRFSFNINGKI